MTTARVPSSALTSFVVASRYLPVYLALLLLLAVAWVWAPATLTSASFGAIAPYGTFLAIAALGQMLVIMTGGIDLSVPGTFTLAGLVVVGVGQSTGGGLARPILTALGVAALIGLVNGILIGGLKLNALIVTLAVGQVVTGILNRYYTSIAIQSSVPAELSAWTSSRLLGISYIFWSGVTLTSS